LIQNNRKEADVSKTITTECDDSGILTLTFDDPRRSMNVLSSDVISELADTLEAAVLNPQVKSILLCSRKAGFVVGADLRELLVILEKRPTLAEGFRLSQRLTLVLRRMETCGKPVAAAINGTALGGGLELCLACHYRVLADDPKALIGLPEVTLGLLPGAGGTQRLSRLVGVVSALPLLTMGNYITPQQALTLGIVHALAAPSDVVKYAREWLLSSPVPVQPWDKKGYGLPGGGGMTPPVAQALMHATARVARTTQRNYPAPIAILSAVFEGCNVPIDAALKIESNHFATLMVGPVPRNMIRTLFVSKGLVDKLAYRPTGITATPVRKLGVIGAGMMGAGVAHVAARAGIPVILLDSSQALANRGKAYSENVLTKDFERGRVGTEAASASLKRITATAEYADLADCDLVIEAVFEQRELKADVIRKCETVISNTVIFASNTSTLPITSLAQNSQRPERFIGIHFFSPVERMPLVEIIVGRQTSQETLARALDFVATLRKTPIIVNDGRGFYTSRVFATYTAEGMKLLEEGVHPALIENAAVAVGMPVGPLAVSDEVTLELQYNATLQGERDLGAAFVAPANYKVLKTMVIDLKRIGKRAGHGFYEYPPNETKYLWPGLSALFPLAAIQPSLNEVKQRLLHIQALESARCFEEGVITRAADADIGSVLGIGFPAYTGGALSYIDTMGIDRFVADCADLADRNGMRFEPSAWLRERAARSAPFHSAV
jgi:3-hydroxyacyl-CoA dehydrogenase / enoyl-CoA hydratase / 3-hydroxybutyryl-CoA epimerase